MLTDAVATHLARLDLVLRLLLRGPGRRRPDELDRRGHAGLHLVHALLRLLILRLLMKKVRMKTDSSAFGLGIASLLYYAASES